MHPDISAAKIEKKSAQITRANTVILPVPTVIAIQEEFILFPACHNSRNLLALSLQAS
jgi:hypothetical protein